MRLVESEDAVSLSGVMEETRLPKTTAARLLRALERNGLAQRRRGGGFRPGPVLVEYARRDSAWAISRPLRCRSSSGSARQRARRRTSPSRLPRASRASHRSTATTPSEPATGSAVASRSTRRRWARSSWPSAPPSPRSAASPASARRRSPRWTTLLAELDRVRRDGYATTWEELEEGLCSAAAPVYGARGSVIAAISVSAPTVRTCTERLMQARPTRSSRRPARCPS